MSRRRHRRKKLSSQQQVLRTARTSRRLIPRAAFVAVDGLWAAVDVAAPHGIELGARRTDKGLGWDIVFSWRGERFGNYWPGAGSLSVAGSTRHAATIMEAVATVRALIDPTHGTPEQNTNEHLHKCTEGIRSEGTRSSAQATT